MKLLHEKSLLHGNKCIFCYFWNTKQWFNSNHRQYTLGRSKRNFGRSKAPNKATKLNTIFLWVVITPITVYSFERLHWNARAWSENFIWVICISIMCGVSLMKNGAHIIWFLTAKLWTCIAYLNDDIILFGFCMRSPHIPLQNSWSLCHRPYVVIKRVKENMK